MIKEAIRKLSYFVFPRRCEICGEVIEFDQCRCNDCKHLSLIDGEICPYCGHLKEDCVCKKHKTEYKCVVAPYYYNNETLVKALHRFKFNNFPELSKGMGADIAKCVKNRYEDISFDYVTYIPISKKRLKKRGYNQALLLANEVSKLIDVPTKELLFKVFDNKAQRTQSARQRKVNVYGAYDVLDSCDVRDKIILLVDDVKTTGSTLNECSKMLKLYGAREVYASTFAITKNNKEKKKK